MGNALLACGDKASLTTGDAALKSLLEGLGHTVTLMSSSESVPAGPWAVIVLTQTGSSTGYGTKFTALSDAVLTCNTGGMITRLDMGSTNSGTRTGTTTQVDLVNNADPVNDALSDPLTVFSAAQGRRGVPISGLASGVTVIGSIDNDSTRATGGYALAGSTSTTGTFPGNRAFLVYEDGCAANLAADGQTWFTRLVSEIQAESTGISTTLGAASESDAAVGVESTAVASVGAASESSSAQPVSSAKASAVSVASESDTAGGVSSGLRVVYLSASTANVTNGTDTSGYAVWQHLLAAGWAVTLVAVADGVPADAAAHDLLIVGNSVPAATSMTAWDAVNIPKLGTGVRSPHTGYAATGSTDAATSLTTTYLTAPSDPAVPSGQVVGNVALHSVAPPKTRYVVSTSLGAGAVKVSQYDSTHPTQVAFSRYAPGAAMATGNAPGRLAWFLSHPADFTATGWSFFDAATSWLVATSVTTTLGAASETSAAATPRRAKLSELVAASEADTAWLLVNAKAVTIGVAAGSDGAGGLLLGDVVFVLGPALEADAPGSLLTSTQGGAVGVLVAALTITMPVSTLTLTYPHATLEVPAMSLHVGDTAPRFTATLTQKVDGTASPLPLAGATVELHFRSPNGSVSTLAASQDSPGTEDGKITAAEWGAMLDRHGLWAVEAEVTYSDGSSQTVGPGSFYVAPEIA